MNDAIWKAMCLALQQATANGEPVTQTPEHLLTSGPCPLCKHRIDPSGFSTATGREKGAEVVGLIVCGGCATPLMYREGGKFEQIPKRLMKKMAPSTRGFIERSQAMIRAIKNSVN